MKAKKLKPSAAKVCQLYSSLREVRISALALAMSLRSLSREEFIAMPVGFQNDVNNVRQYLRRDLELGKRNRRKPL